VGFVVFLLAMSNFMGPSRNNILGMSGKEFDIFFNLCFFIIALGLLIVVIGLFQKPRIDTQKRTDIE
jgi:NhaP-type Na+/H+ or K+/H+ antiporter